MAKAQEFQLVKYFCGILTAAGQPLTPVENKLVSTLGPVDFRSEAIRFTFTDYYSEQMGSEIERRFVSFEALRDPSELSEIKRLTNRIEEDVSEHASLPRPANIDPGYLTEANMVLASAKPFAHRLPLSAGIYGQLEYLFTRSGVRFLDWTFPEYRSKVVVDFFLELRNIYRTQLGKT